MGFLSPPPHPRHVPVGASIAGSQLTGQGVICRAWPWLPGFPERAHTQPTRTCTGEPSQSPSEFAAESPCSRQLCPGPPHPFAQDRTWTLESSRHAGLEPALSPSLPICEMGVMSECQGHISCRVSHLFNARAQPRHLKVGLQPPREPCSQEQAVCSAQAGVLAAAPFSAPAAVAPDLCPLPQLGVQLKKGGMFENIFPELLLQFATALGARQWMPALPLGGRGPAPALQGVRVTHGAASPPLPTLSKACVHAC